jgi:hypothetical protein
LYYNNKKRQDYLDIYNIRKNNIVDKQAFLNLLTKKLVVEKDKIKFVLINLEKNNLVITYKKATCLNRYVLFFNNVDNIYFLIIDILNSFNIVIKKQGYCNKKEFIKHDLDLLPKSLGRKQKNIINVNNNSSPVIYEKYFSKYNKKPIKNGRCYNRNILKLPTIKAESLLV